MVATAAPAFEDDALTGRAADVERLLSDMAGAGSLRTSILASTAAATTSVDELIRIKEDAKTLAADASDGPHREAARLLYHLAVAAAFVHHGAAISGRPLAKQQGLYDQLAEAWAEHAIGRVFRNAAMRLADSDRARHKVT